MIPRRPLGRCGGGGSSGPLPPYFHTMDGPFGYLTDPMLPVIHVDERWYGDGTPNWKKAPTGADAHAKRVEAANRLGHANYALVTGAAALALIIASCSPESRCGSHACPECGRADQRWLVAAFRKVLRQHQVGYQDFSFNFVMPEGQTRIEDICGAPFDYILDKCRAALDECEAVEFAALGTDTSANDDTEKFKHGRLTFGPRKYWQVHVYGVVRTSDRQAVWDALRPLFNGAANIYRPLTISPEPFNGSPLGLSYVCKPHAFQHKPFLGMDGEWNTPRKAPALTARQHLHYLLAMHDLGLPRRIAFVGLHPEITKATKTRNHSVRLRRVARGKRRWIM